MKRLYMKQYFDALHCVTVFGKTIFKNIEKGLSDNINNCHSFFYKPNRKEAFTLAETIITLSIIGIIAVIIVEIIVKL